MEELLNAIRLMPSLRIANSSIEQKVSLLPQALEYGEQGIDFLIDCLQDAELEVRAKAYNLLQDIDSDKVRNAIAPGLLFNPGDKIYRIHKSTMWFNDSFYNFYQPEDINEAKHLITYDDYKHQGYKIIRFDEAAYVTTWTPYYTSYQQAKSAAELLHNKRIFEVSITEFDLRDNQATIKQWCDRYQITQEVNKLENKKNGLDEGMQLHGMSNKTNYLYWSTVEEYLRSSQNNNLLNQLWQDLVGRFAVVNEVIFDKKTYLTIDPYYSQIIGQEDNFKYSYGQEEDDYYQTETSLLLIALNSPQLKIRVLAYQLLQGIDSEKAQQAIYQGVKLKPGDKIYSVYQSGIGYTDEIYYILRDEVDYYEQLDDQISTNYEDDPRQYSQRIYCYTEKKQAEAAAEILHRKLIKENNPGFEWRKSNPSFDLKKWCEDNKITYNKEWDKCQIPWNGFNSFTAIFKVKDFIREDDRLTDSLRRSRYIYHPAHMDTWCKDNNICYEQICDENNKEYWHNYRKVLDYINLPENIELLSKFWKDGVGHFAFVKEEIMQQTVYVRIGHELDSEAGENKIFALPKGYEEKAGKLLINIIENKIAGNQSKSKARDMLQEIKWDEIPF